MTLVILNDSMTLVDQHGCYIEYFKHNLKAWGSSNLKEGYKEMVKKSALSNNCRIQNIEPPNASDIEQEKKEEEQYYLD